MRAPAVDPPRRAPSLRALVQAICILGVSLMMAAPLLLGVAMTPLMRALGSEVQHACACGMAPGKCGCSECERLERARRTSALERVPVVKSHCDTDQSAPLEFPALPPAVLAHTILVAPAPERVVLAVLPSSLEARDPEPPPTPPPRA